MVRYILRENRYLDIYPGKTMKILIVKKRVHSNYLIRFTKD